MYKFVILGIIILLCVWSANNYKLVQDKERLFQGHQLMRGIEQYKYDEKDNLLDPDARYNYFKSEYPKRYNDSYYRYFPYNLYDFFPSYTYNYDTAINYTTAK
jgi:hypothetical protein